MTQLTQNVRRGLPRVAGGAPWPPVEGAPAVPGLNAAPDHGEPAYAAAVPRALPDPLTSITSGAITALNVSASAAAAAAAAPVTAAPAAPAPGTARLRRGLPRVAGEAAWPPESAHAPVLMDAVAPVTPRTPSPASPVQRPTGPDPAPRLVPAPAAPAAPAAPVPPAPPASPAVPQRAAAVADPAPKTSTRVARRATLGALATVAAAGIIVLAARGVTTLPGVPEFLVQYPGEYALPAFVDDGFPAWARWTHFLNFFFLALIVRTGLLVRHQQTPPAFFTPRRGGKKVSLNLWLHTSVDVLWMASGVTFVVLLFATGHWARIVPTSWDVFPNAASAMLQYLTLEWPLEDGWVNYNSLQQLMYFAVVFIAAPLAIISGVRMSEWWPKRAERLSRAYPTEVARAIHFPVMLFFVLFVIVHVFLVLTTGALKNLNHMFVGVSAPSWVGFWWFAGSLVVTAAVVWAVRPLVFAPIAQLFGKVSSR